MTIALNCSGPDLRLSWITPSQFDHAFDQIGPVWRHAAKAMNDDASAVLAHAPSAAPNNSDLGVMMAWTRLIQGQPVPEQANAEINCPDPWLFRHFSGLPQVQATGSRPGFWRLSLGLWLRGYAARLRFAWRTALACRQGQATKVENAAAMLVYDHPASTAAGHDAYFGPLLNHVPGLYRALHVDAPASAGRRLHGSVSLHAWGSPFYALFCLPFAKWRPSAAVSRGAWGWLIRRAAALEGGTAQAAAIAWQIHCQARWLRAARPKVVTWPWENHGWERALVRQARSLGLRTIGCQHSVVGQQFNMSNIAPDLLPDLIATNGPSAYRQLLERDIPADRLVIAGSLRFTPSAGQNHDPAGPVFLAMPFDRRVAAQMIEAARPLSESGITVLVRDHPLFPVDFTATETLRRAPGPLQSSAGLRAVVYAATTVGLEALLAGLPVIRFIPSGCVAVDILPNSLRIPTADSAALVETVLTARQPPPLRWSDIFSPPDMDFWRGQLT
ncbi:MAG: hypothetical protein FD176_339 [Rhodospirillaceae bacterium]|nr:MAG: hypothetical protein FD176_339 [Rhodospirillaceae bacterium]TNC97412.1 MAG: hypothetical protein FD119_1012 [Stygiobacter sp.]